MQRIFLIRHGLTAANRQDRFAGRTNEALLEEGHAQLAEVVPQLNSQKIEIICCGPLVRTVQSAEFFSRMLHCPIELDEGLNEILLPHWDGLSKEEIRCSFGEQYPTWLAHPDRFAVPGCETLAEVQVRAVQALRNRSARHLGKNMLIVSHLIVLRSLLLYSRRLPLAEFRSIKIANAQVEEFLWPPDQGGN